MHEFNSEDLKKLYVPPSGSHKGQNGKLLLIGGSHLFHAASLWALNVASKIVDMVFYSSVPENNQIVHEAKKEFRDGIVVPRENIEDYINEADCVLIGPGMIRTDDEFHPKSEYMLKDLSESSEIEHEGIKTYYITKYLVKKYPNKKWVIDGGALQMMEKEWLRGMPDVILTPHKGEFERLFGLPPTEGNIERMAREYGVIILCKGEEDVVCPSADRALSDGCVIIKGGNAGMTKGGSGDVLAGLVAGLACKNDLFLAAKAGSYINKKAGESLFARVGYTFNSSDLVDEIPEVMNRMVAWGR